MTDQTNRSELRTPEAALEILAREMYVAEHSDPAFAREARGQWYREVAAIRGMWRATAARVHDSIASSGLDVTWTED